MRKNRLTVKFNRTHKISAIKNSKICCVYARAMKSKHQGSKLILKAAGQEEVELDGTQIRSLQKVLNSACK